MSPNGGLTLYMDSQPMYQNGKKDLDYKAQFSIICWYICILCQKQAHLCLGWPMELWHGVGMRIALKEVVLKLPWKRCRSCHKRDAMYRTFPWFLSCWKTREVSTKEITKVEELTTFQNIYCEDHEDFKRMKAMKTLTSYGGGGWHPPVCGTHHMTIWWGHIEV